MKRSFLLPTRQKSPVMSDQRFETDRPATDLPVVRCNHEQERSCERSPERGKNRDLLAHLGIGEIHMGIGEV